MSQQYERRHIISTRTDIRLLAGLVMFYKSENALPRTKSSLVGDIIEDFARFLETKGKLKIPKTFSEALGVLKQFDFNFINKKEVLKSLAKEEYEHISSEMASIDKKIAQEVGKDIAGN